MDLNKKQILEIVTYWQDSADHDLKVAETLWKAKQYDASLFFCHLTVEKLLKSHIVNHTKKHAPYIHDLLRLSEFTGIHFNNEEQEILKIMSSFNLEARYPEDKFSFYKKCRNIKFSQMYYDFTKKIMKTLKMAH